MEFLTWLSKLDTRQWLAASRQYVSFAAGILATLGLIGVTQSQDLIKAVSDFITGATQIVAGLGVLAGAIIAIKNSFTAAHNASPQVAVQRVEEIAKDPNSTLEAKNALITATSNLTEVTAVGLDPKAPDTRALTASTPANVQPVA